MSIFSKVIVPILMVGFCFAAPAAAIAQTAASATDQPSEATWDNIKGDIFKEIGRAHV